MSARLKQGCAMRALRLVSLAVVSIAIPGCTVGPNYERPEVVAPPNWRLDLPTAQNVANTRWWEQFGDPALAVTATKQRRLRQLAATWLSATGTHGVDVRFDVVAVTGVQIRVIEAAF